MTFTSTVPDLTGPKDDPGEPGPPGGVIPAIIAITQAMGAMVLVFVFRPKAAEAA